MKRFLSMFILIAMLTSVAFANGVLVIDGRTGIYLRLDSTVVNVDVQSQIAITTTTQYYYNAGASNFGIFAFPLPEQASAVRLRTGVAGIWETARIDSVRQDTTIPGGTSPANLTTYLGHTPLFYTLPQYIRHDSTIAVELTYVELLPYTDGSVSYTYPSDYHLIQSSVIQRQRFNFNITSPRSIDSLLMTSSHPTVEITNNGTSGVIRVSLVETAINQNYGVRYRLNANQLGLFAYSTSLPTVPDTLGNGFLTFIAEPDPSQNTRAISKVFSLIIDRSGSMSGTKITQAKNAATFIVNNLNEGDRFNLIDFDDAITCFRPRHVMFTNQSRDSALTYINGLYARNMTSISGVFAQAIPQFTFANDSTANIVIFLTDGQPTVGITSPTTLVTYVDSLIRAAETNICLFNFGIGSDVNRQLLAQMSAHNHGVAEFLGNDELYARITSFYTTIRNPVLLDSRITFTPPIVSQVYPDTLPNLYKGKQMIISGRYSQAANVLITLSGNAFGNPVAYNYNVQLNEGQIESNQFLPKVWAKRKIESLLVRYYTLSPTSSAAVALRSQIILISQQYGVISPFTSFSGNPNDVDENPGEAVTDAKHPASFELLGNYPNPFNPTTTIKFRLNINYRGIVDVRIYNVLGQLIRTLHVRVNGQGEYEILWDGLADNSLSLSNGTYFYAIDIQNTILMGKMNLLK